MAIERLFIGEGVKEVEVKNYLEKELKRAGLAGITIQRTPLVTRIVLHCDRPALVIGRKGGNVKQITKTIEEVYKIEKPELEIKKVENPNLEPNIVAYRIASALERGMNPRKVGYKALQAILADGAKGAEIVMSGKLIGKGGRARVLKMRAGYMKKCGRPSIEQVLHGRVSANCKPGVIGISVDIVPANIHFPDEVNIIAPGEIEIAEEVIEQTTPVVEVVAEGAREAPAGAKFEKPKEKKAKKPKTDSGAHTEKPKVAKKPKVEGGTHTEKPKAAKKEETKPEEKSIAKTE